MNAPENESLKFKIRVLIRHPTADPSEITNGLGIEPNNFRRAGEIRKTPLGAVLGGVNEYSMWSKSFFVERERRFFHSGLQILDLLERKKEFVEQITETGGSIQLIADLSGMQNIGDVIFWNDLKRLSDLKIDLGVEVFPNF